MNQKSWESSMSLEETKRVLAEVNRLEAMGDEEGAYRLSLTLPMKPSLADDIKRLNGIQWLIDGGYNLTDAVRKFGQEWLRA